MDAIELSGLDLSNLGLEAMTLPALQETEKQFLELGARMYDDLALVARTFGSDCFGPNLPYKEYLSQGFASYRIFNGLSVTSLFKERKMTAFTFIETLYITTGAPAALIGDLYVNNPDIDPNTPFIRREYVCDLSRLVTRIGERVEKGEVNIRRRNPDASFVPGPWLLEFLQKSQLSRAHELVNEMKDWKSENERTRLILKLQGYA